VGEPFRTATERADARWHRALGLSLLIALILHLAILISIRSTPLPRSPFSAAGPNRGDYTAAAGGGGGLTMIEIREPSAPLPEPVPVPVPVPEPIPEPEVDPETTEPAEIEEEDEVAVTLPGLGQDGTGGEAGTDAGPGTATGTGEGGGGTEDSGDSGMIAPRPRGILIPPAGRPASARGQEITVWVFVAPNGRVLADSTRLDPPTSDGRYNNRLRQTVSDWVFEPARRAGQAVAAWYPFQIIL
jgi:hypothetical protein